MGYRNRTIRQDFTDLGDDIYVTIRNPKLLPLSALTPEDIPVDANGNPQRREDMIDATNGLMAGVIVSWNVPDPTEDSDDAESMPLTRENVGKVPVEILSWVQEQITEAITGKKSGADPQDHLAEVSAPN